MVRSLQEPDFIAGVNREVSEGALWGFTHGVMEEKRVVNMPSLTMPISSIFSIIQTWASEVIYGSRLRSPTQVTCTG